MPNPDAVPAREPHERVRLEEFQYMQLPDGQWLGRVVVAWHPGSDFVGTAKGTASPEGQLRCAAEATACAVARATGNKVALQVLGVTAIEAYDTVLVVVSFEALGLVEQLVGSCLIKEQSSRAACLAVLHAANRRLGMLVNDIVRGS